MRYSQKVVLLVMPPAATQLKHLFTVLPAAACLQFDPQQFTMERLTRNTGSLKMRQTVTVQNQPHDEVCKQRHITVAPAQATCQQPMSTCTLSSGLLVQEVAISESESMASPSEASQRGVQQQTPSRHSAAGGQDSRTVLPVCGAPPADPCRTCRTAQLTLNAGILDVV